MLENVWNVDTTSKNRLHSRDSRKSKLLYFDCMKTCSFFRYLYRSIIKDCLFVYLIWNPSNRTNTSYDSCKTFSRWYTASPFNILIRSYTNYTMPRCCRKDRKTAKVQMFVGLTKNSIFFVLCNFSRDITCLSINSISVHDVCAPEGNAAKCFLLLSWVSGHTHEGCFESDLSQSTKPRVDW